MSIALFLNITRSYRKASLENHLYEETRILMEKIVREVRRGTVDYEEYHNRLVLNGDHGANYGEYGSKFYHPGYRPLIHTEPDCTTLGFIWDGTGCLHELGAVCNEGGVPAPTCPGSEVLYLDSLDKATGRNPYSGAYAENCDPTIPGIELCSEWNATAFCDTAFISYGDDMPSPDPRACPADLSTLFPQSQLYLINSGGDLKTILAPEDLGDPDGAGPIIEHEFALSIVRMEGNDSDQDDINDEWVCGEAFVCPLASDLPDLQDLEDPATCAGPPCDDSGMNLAGTIHCLHAWNFVPITPPTITVKEVTFYVAPLEDPRKAFDEDDHAIHQQPHVTIVLTTEPSYTTYRDLKFDPGSLPVITLQTTVSSRTYNEVKSY